MNLKSKIISLSLLSVLIPLITLSVFSYNYMWNVFEKQSISSAATVTERSVQQFDNQCSVLATNLSNVANSTNLKNYITVRNNTPTDRVLLMYHTRLYNVELTSFILFSGGIVRSLMLLWDDQSMPIVKGMPSFSYYGDYQQDALFQLGKKSAVIPAWTYSETKEGLPYLSVVTSVYGGYRAETTGVVVLELQISMLEDFFTPSSGLERERGLLLDEGHRVLYDSDDTLTSQIATWDWLNGMSDRGAGFYVNLDGQRYLVTHRVSDVTGWVAVNLLPYRHIAKAVSQHWAVTGILIVLCVFSAILIASLSYSMLYKPVQGLMSAIKQFGKGHLDVRLTVRRKDEIGALYRQYNEMADHIKRLIKEVEAYQQRQKDLEIYFMQAQTIPHFLSNSLCNIAVLAQEDRREEIIRMSTALERLTRVVSKRELMIPLADEVCYVLDYLDVMRLRYQTEIAVTCDIPDEALQVCLPKFTLQPLVENCFQHAFVHMEGVPAIDISGKIEGDDLIISIVDNGAGTDQTLEEILAAAQENERNRYRASIGLRNVHERLQLLYDARCGLRFESVPGKGTCIRVIISRKGPAQKTTWGGMEG